MTRTLLTALFLTLFSQTAGAKTVYYCTGTQLAEIKANKLKNYKPQNFKFSVDQKRLIFGSGGYFSENEMLIEKWISETLWKARDGAYGIVSFKDGEFVAAVTTIGEDGPTGVLVSAECDKF